MLITCFLWGGLICPSNLWAGSLPSPFSLHPHAIFPFLYIGHLGDQRIKVHEYLVSFQKSTQQ